MGMAMNEELRDKTMRTVCIDFDGVLYDYKGWVEPPTDLPEPPVPGAVAFCVEAVKHFHVVVCSARFRYPNVFEAVTEWMKKYRFPEMELTYIKPLAFVYIDDRGWTFKGTFPTIEELNKFITWQDKARINNILTK